MNKLQSDVDPLEFHRDLRRCSAEIKLLQEELNLRHVEASCTAEHVRGLELKLAEVRKLGEEVVLLRDELSKSESERLFLIELLEKRDIELEAALLSSTALESQCELEAVKLDLVELENQCYDAILARDRAFLERDELGSWIQELEKRLEESQKRIGFLEEENCSVVEKLEKFVVSFTELQDFFYGIDRSNRKHGVGEFDVRNEDRDNSEFNISKRMHRTITCEDELRTTHVKLAAKKPSNGIFNGEFEKMSHQIIESELLVNQLKEELKVEKLKAKEEAEDLTQEMAELRYQITEMLEHECKRRACIEQASLRRIEELEAQVREERERFSVVNGQLNTVRKLFQSGSIQPNPIRFPVIRGFQMEVRVQVSYGLGVEAPFIYQMEWRLLEQNHSVGYIKWR